MQRDTIKRNASLSKRAAANCRIEHRSSVFSRRWQACPLGGGGLILHRTDPRCTVILRRLLLALACFGAVGCGGSKTSATQQAISELRQSEASGKRAAPEARLPAQYVAALEEVCARYELRTLNLPGPPESGSLSAAARANGRQLRAEYLAQVRRVTVAARAQRQRRSFLRSLEMLLHDEVVYEDFHFHLGELVRFKDILSNLREAGGLYDSKRLELGVVRCRA